MTTVLQSLYERWGFGRSELADLIDVPASRVPNWGHGEPSGAVCGPLAWLDVFCCQLYANNVAEPAAWLSVPVVGGYTITRTRLYQAGQFQPLLDNASGQIGDVNMLYVFDRDWKLNYWTDFEVFVASDGHNSIRRKAS